MAEIIWTNPALDDLNDIAEYIALSNLQSAKNWFPKYLKKLNVSDSFLNQVKNQLS